MSTLIDFGNFSNWPIACFRQQSKEGLAKTAGSITENLMSIAKMMESQVQQSQNNTEVLGTYFYMY